MKNFILIVLLAGIITSCKKEAFEDPAQPSVEERIIKKAYVPVTKCDINWNADVEYDTVSDIDGNVYATVIIGDQEWMAENLATTKFNNGDTIAFANNLTASPAYTWATDNEGISLKDCYGNSYNGQTIIDERNICPVGWKVPSIEDWNELDDYLKSNFTNSPEYNLKASEGWFSAGNNASGFRLLPSGYINVSWSEVRETGEHGEARVWSSTFYNSSSIGVKYTHGSWITEVAYVGEYNSIRCLKE